MLLGRMRIRAVAVLLCAWTMGAATAQDAGSQRPNVVLIYGDDVGYGDLSCYGATEIATPHLDRLAERGLRFTRAYAPAATCTPSRYSILTGQYAWRREGTRILPGDAGLIIPTDKMTLGKMFQGAGYQTACIGKWHLGLGGDGGPDWNGEIKPGPNEVGFDYSFIMPATNDRVPTVYVRDHRVVGLDPADPIEVNYKEKVGTDFTGKENPELLKMKSAPNHGHDNTIVNGIGRIGWMSGGNAARWTDESTAEDFLAETEMFIERADREPFFIYLALHDIHVPRMPNTRFKGVSGLGYRGDTILQMDYIVGRVVQKLDERGLTSNTIVMFSSDNGPVLNDGYVDGAVDQLGGHKPAGPFRGGKYSNFEAGARVPFIVAGPGIGGPGVSDAMISQVDLLATFAKMTGQEIPTGDAVDSRDMLDVLARRDAAGRDALVFEAFRTRSYLEGDWKYIEPGSGPAVMKRTNIESGRSKSPQLYNLADDPGEKTNLAASNPEKLEAMQAALESLSDAAE